MQRSIGSRPQTLVVFVCGILGKTCKAYNELNARNASTKYSLTYKNIFMYDE